MGQFLYFILTSLFTLVIWALIINAVLSWLVHFEVINARNRVANSVIHMLDAVCRPILAPFQRIIPTMGGVDISPIIVILILYGIRDILLPRYLLGPLVAALG